MIKWIAFFIIEALLIYMVVFEDCSDLIAVLILGIYLVPFIFALFEKNRNLHHDK